MGFAQTADYFHRRANQAHEPDDKQRFLEIAGFCRKLAWITPDFPADYRAEGNHRASRWEARAEECRALADQLSDPKCRAQMAELAETYAGMAKAAE
jgi:hypothetical protein